LKPLHVAVAMLALGFLRHYGWAVFAIEDRGMASKGLGAVALLGMVWIAYALCRSRLVLIVAAVWSVELLQTVICTASWIFVAPWDVPEGVPICSAAVGADIGAFTIVGFALVAYYIARRL
jgi:hypothetical protein